jgi:predicted methyltransferase
MNSHTIAGRIGIGSLVVLGLAACGQQSAQPPAAAPTAATQPAAPATDATAIQSAFTNPNRFAADAGEDSWRKSAEVLAFFNVQPGMHVIDYLAAGGYYTELLSTLVGPQGQVIAYNNDEYARYVGDKPAQRYANNRLPNVVQLGGRADELSLEPNSLDAALFVQTYHDLYWRPKDGSWKPVDPAQSLAKLVPALKPGAVVLVIDHVATPGGDTSQTVDALHRIDPAVVRRDFEAAGLVFDSESSILSNPADDHTKVVFDPAVSHKTDQFVYRFRKPGA